MYKRTELSVKKAVNMRMLCVSMVVAHNVESNKNKVYNHNDYVTEVDDEYHFNNPVKEYNNIDDVNNENRFGKAEVRNEKANNYTNNLFRNVG